LIIIQAVCCFIILYKYHSKLNSILVIYQWWWFCFKNGRWRSQWSVPLTEKQAELKGTIKVQVHYYEDGNVQLVSSKDITRKITVSVG
jgi:hypothetical protein